MNATKSKAIDDDALIAVLEVSSKPLSARAVCRALAGEQDAFLVSSRLCDLVERGSLVTVDSDGPNTLFDVPRTPKTRSKREPQPRAARASTRSTKGPSRPSGETLSSSIRRHLLRKPKGDGRDNIRQAMRARATGSQVDALLGGMTQSGQIQRVGRGSTSRFVLTSKGRSLEIEGPRQPARTAPKSSPAEPPSLLGEWLEPTIEGLIRARREADKILRALAMASKDAKLKRAAVVAHELHFRTEALIKHLQS